MFSVTAFAKEDENYREGYSYITDSSGNGYWVAFPYIEDLKLNTWIYRDTLAWKKYDTLLKIEIPSNGYVTFETKESLVFRLRNEKGEKESGLLWNAKLNANNGFEKTTYLEAGIYYVEIESSIGADLHFKCSFSTSKKDTTLKEGKTLTVNPNLYEKTYLKFKASKTGYITLTCSPVADATDIRIALCDNQKNEITVSSIEKDTSSKTGKITFAVTKNVFYYLKLNSSSSALEIKCSTINTNNPGTPKKNAITLKSNDKHTGNKIYCHKGDVQTDWYKFTLSKKKTVRITGHSNSVGKIKIELYNAKNKKLLTKTINSKWTQKTYKLENLAKGTYYIKISCLNYKSYGTYTIKWK